MRTWALLVIALTGTSAAQKPDPVADLLRAADAYVEAYLPTLSGVSLQEDFLLIEVAGTRGTVPVRISSDLLVVNVDGLVLGLRDVYAVDTRPTRPRQPRMAVMLEEASVSKWEAALDFAEEGTYHFRSGLVWRYTDPTMVLQFLDRQVRDRVSFKAGGKRKMDGTSLVALEFKETKGELVHYVLDTPGNAWASGRFWIDPSSGAIHQTDLWFESKEEVARIAVTYGRDVNLDLLVPREATVNFEIRHIGSGITNMGVGGKTQRQTFDTTAKYSSPTQRRLDLRRIARPIRKGQ